MKDDYDDYLPYNKLYECTECEKKDRLYAQMTDDARDYLEGVMKQLYSDEPLDVFKLEGCLDELCHLLNVKMNPSDLKIQRSKKEDPKLFSNWIAFNQDFLAKQA